MKQIQLNNLDPITKTFQRTDKDDYRTTKYFVRMKDMQRIEERITYKNDGTLSEIYIVFSDETSRKPSTKNPGEIVTYRDEITFNWQSADRWDRENGEEYERVSWSTGWQSDMEGKMKEAEIRQKALKYFAKRKAQLVK